MVPDANSLRDDGSFETTFHLEAPVGLIQIRAQCKGRKAVQITLTNTVSFMDPKYENISVRLPLPIRSILGSTKAMNEGTNGMNESVTVDIAFGGMWYIVFLSFFAEMFFLFFFLFLIPSDCNMPVIESTFRIFKVRHCGHG